MADFIASSSRFAEPQLGASLLLAFTPPAAASPSSSAVPAVPARRTVLIIGQARLAAARAFSCLEADLDVVVAKHSALPIDVELQDRIESGKVATVELSAESQEQATDWQQWLRGLDPELLDDVLLVCVTDTIITAAAVALAASASSGLSCGATARSPLSALAIRQACFRLRIPVNIADHPQLSDFHFPATYRFPLLPTPQAAPAFTASANPAASPLQIAITTNASSCRLASRIRREIVSKLPKGVGSAVARVGQLRETAREIDNSSSRDAEEGEREEGWSSTLLNRPVPQILLPTSISGPSRCTSPRKGATLLPAGPGWLQASHVPLTPPATPPATSMLNKMEEILAGKVDVPSYDANASMLTRMRFIAQISEYWPIERLATLSDAEAARVVSLYAKEKEGQASEAASGGEAGSSVATQTVHATASTSASASANESSPNEAYLGNDVTPRHGLALMQPPAKPSERGRIFLLGSGPGSPALLTRAAHALLTSRATLILSDKLVPPEILALIPKHIPLTIAKKFPGNAEGAQNELMDLAYEGAMRGETVVRLKQGDPYVYGRGGEEVLFFRERGFEAVVVPGISSAFAAPLMAGIPVTQRGVSESVVVCTGVGRKGKGVKLPGYERARTTVVLMGVARLPGVIHALTSVTGEEGHGREGGAREGAAYPPYCPIAIIERGSSPDQRLVASTLEGIVEAMDRAGEQRPPGMMIIGWSALALEGQGDVTVLDGVDGKSAEEMEKIDRERVQRWLGPQGYIVREGLDASWEDLE